MAQSGNCCTSRGDRSGHPRHLPASLHFGIAIDWPLAGLGLHRVAEEAGCLYRAPDIQGQPRVTSAPPMLPLAPHLRLTAGVSGMSNGVMMRVIKIATAFLCLLLAPPALGADATSLGFGDNKPCRSINPAKDCDAIFVRSLAVKPIREIT